MYNMEVINLASSPNRVCSTRCVIFTVSGLKGPLVSGMTILLNPQGRRIKGSSYLHCKDSNSLVKFVFLSLQT